MIPPIFKHEKNGGSESERLVFQALERHFRIENCEAVVIHNFDISEDSTNRRLKKLLPGFQIVDDPKKADGKTHLEKGQSDFIVLLPNGTTVSIEVKGREPWLPPFICKICKKQISRTKATQQPELQQPADSSKTLLETGQCQSMRLQRNLEKVLSAFAALKLSETTNFEVITVLPDRNIEKRDELKGVSSQPKFYVVSGLDWESKLRLVLHSLVRLTPDGRPSAERQQLLRELLRWLATGDDLAANRNHSHVHFGQLSAAIVDEASKMRQRLERKSGGSGSTCCAIQGTKDQLRMLDASSERLQNIVGVSGTGKTMCMQLKAEDILKKVQSTPSAAKHVRMEHQQQLILYISACSTKAQELHKDICLLADKQHPRIGSNLKYCLISNVKEHHSWPEFDEMAKSLLQDCKDFCCQLEKLASATVPKFGDYVNPCVLFALKSFAEKKENFSAESKSGMANVFLSFKGKDLLVEVDKFATYFKDIHVFLDDFSVCVHDRGENYHVWLFLHLLLQHCVDKANNFAWVATDYMIMMNMNRALHNIALKEDKELDAYFNFFAGDDKAFKRQLEHAILNSSLYDIPGYETSWFFEVLVSSRHCFVEWSRHSFEHVLPKRTVEERVELAQRFCTLDKEREMTLQPPPYYPEYRMGIEPFVLDLHGDGPSAPEKELFSMLRAIKASCVMAGPLHVVLTLQTERLAELQLPTDMKSEVEFFKSMQLLSHLFPVIVLVALKDGEHFLDEYVGHSRSSTCIWTIRISNPGLIGEMLKNCNVAEIN